ncbi:hypothetical protein TIFTF001_012435 [Ficus carica]|uniref:Uncharacterized protein n=1 Tax=Ficus carica TaxID=3494 RepID=A0AA88D1S6_FICCA|nr:hypothetical protein TIFTF001_012435 [Ficus carica]
MPSPSPSEVAPAPSTRHPTCPPCRSSLPRDLSGATATSPPQRHCNSPANRICQFTLIRDEEES